MTEKLDELIASLKNEDYPSAFSLAKNLTNEGPWDESDARFINYALCVAGSRMGLYEESIAHGEKVKDNPFLLGRVAISKLFLALAFSNYMLFKQTKKNVYLMSAQKYVTISQEYQSSATREETAEVATLVLQERNNTKMKKGISLKNTKRHKVLSVSIKLLILLALAAGIVIFSLEWLK